MRIHRIVGVIIGFMLLVSGPGAAIAQEGTPDGSGSLLSGYGYPELAVTATDDGIADPGEVEAGLTLITFTNDSTVEADLELYPIADSAAYEDLIDAFAAYDPASGAPPDYFYGITIGGGVKALPGASGQVVVDLVPGTYAFNYYGSDEDAGIDVNIPTEVVVTGEPTDATPPEADVTAEMFEMDFAMPTEIAAGPAIWEVTNTGDQPHFLLLSQYPEAFTEEEVLELLMAFGPPASPEAATAPPALDFELFEDAYESSVLSAGQTNWLEIDLEPGYYVALCFVPDPETGAPHALLGMYELFEVV